MREPGANPGRSRRCEGRRSPATKPLAQAGKAAREGAPSQKTCRAPHIRTPRGREDSGASLVLVLSPDACWPRSPLSVAGASGGASRAVGVSRSRRRARTARSPSRSGRRRIVSLSPTATETLFAIGAGSQVVAVDDQSDFPKSAPKTSLSGFTPNVEAIAAYRPDLVVIAYDPKGLSGALGRLGITVLHQDGAKSFKGAYQQIRQLGLVTGREARAAKLIASMKARIGEDRRRRAEGTCRPDRVPRAHARPLLGDVEDVRRPGLHGARAAQHRRRGSDSFGTGYPQLSSEYIVSESPDVIVLADTVCCGEKPSTVARGPAGIASAPCARARSSGSTTRSRRAGGHGS